MTGSRTGQILDPDGQAGQRLDQWLFFARITKSRTLSQALIERGKVRVNADKAGKASHWLKLGDAITISLGPNVRVIKVLGIASRRGPAAEAQTLYEELTPSTDKTTCSVEAGGQKRVPGVPLPSSGVRLPGSGRPTKRERRETDRLKTRELED